MTNQPFLQEVENDSGLTDITATHDWLKENKKSIENVKNNIKNAWDDKKKFENQAKMIRDLYKSIENLWKSMKIYANL